MDVEFAKKCKLNPEGRRLYWSVQSQPLSHALMTSCPWSPWNILKAAKRRLFKEKKSPLSDGKSNFHSGTGRDWKYRGKQWPTQSRELPTEVQYNQEQSVCIYIYMQYILDKIYILIDLFIYIYNLNSRHPGLRGRLSLLAPSRITKSGGTSHGMTLSDKRSCTCRWTTL